MGDHLTRFLFDVDGTLTDARQQIDARFEDFMVEFCSSNRVAFVTGSDKEKTVEQLGSFLFGLVDYSFNCAGNEVWHKGNLVVKNEWEPSIELCFFLEELLSETKYSNPSGKYALTMERRNGMLNFSVPGRRCTKEDRAAYVAWDKSTAERERFRDKIAHKFPELDVMIGGDTSIDIYPVGRGKEQVIDFLRNVENEKTYYFGDQIFPGGNDYTIAQRCEHSYRVKNWQETHEILGFLKETAFCE